MGKEAKERAVPLLGPAPPPSSEAVRRLMVGNRGKDTKPEVAVRKALREASLTGYRIDWKKAPGRPDIAFVGHRVAVFVHGCFWHRCPHCQLPNPRTNSEYWQRKFVRNKERDARKVRELEAAGWRVVELWECKTQTEMDVCVSKVKQALERD